MKPERIELQRATPSWLVFKPSLGRTYDLASFHGARTFGAFVAGMAEAGPSEVELSVNGQLFTVEITSAEDVALTAAEHQLARAIDAAYDLFVGTSRREDDEEPEVEQQSKS